MRFGVQLNHRYSEDDDLTSRIHEAAQTTELIRDLGYDSVFVHHHFVAEEPTPQALPLLGYLAAVSGQMRLGVGVYVATLEHPVALAEHFATVDQITGGRLVWGVGSGYRPAEFSAFGADIADRQDRLYETLEIVRRLWSGEAVVFRGRHFQLDGARIGIMPKQSPGPPIWIGAMGRSAILGAAGHGNTWLCAPIPTLDVATAQLRAFKDAQARLGIETRSCEYPLLRELCIADSDEDARAIAGEGLWKEYRERHAESYETLMRDAFLIGSPQTVAANLRRYADAGWNTFIFRVNWQGMSPGKARATLERFMAEVAPALESATA
jgi:alkanesulfonate monooxygenase SsuD/methylene tetrahydromethanopterin reductase-like flavin-dependent oxidoreductase (luciferase family)